MVYIKVSVVIPAYNEENTIKDVIEASRLYCDEIIVSLARHSDDNTLEIAKSAGVSVIRDNGNGKGDGMRHAIEKVGDGIIVFIDADGSHKPEDIPLLIKPIKDGNADMVIASRFLGGSEELHGDFNKFMRMFFSMCIAQAINWRFNASIMDTQNGFRAIRVDVAKSLDLKSNHTEIETEISMKCFKKGYRILEIPSMELKRKHGESGISLCKHGPKYLWTVIRNL